MQMNAPPTFTHVDLTVSQSIINRMHPAMMNSSTAASAM
jgi:hypothetical protein